MKIYSENRRDIPVIDEFDVIVCGGGPTGFMAAIAAARRGARTLLIEKYGFLGGTGTAAMMLEFGSIFDGKDVLLGGCAHEFLHRLVNEGYGEMHSEKTHNMVFDPEGMIAICQKMVLESGSELLLHSVVVDVIRDGNKAKGIVVENKSGRGAYMAQVIIDATGDGDIAFCAGEEFSYGNEEGRVQPVSLEFLLGNVNHRKITSRNVRQTLPYIRQAKENGDWKIPSDQFFSWGRVKKRGAPDVPESSFYFINATNALDINGVDANDLTKAEIECRRQVDDLIYFLQKYVPGFEKCYLDRTAVQIGIRETRRICGKYKLTQSDVLAGKHFDDGIVPGCNSIDVHDVKGKEFLHKFLKKGTHYQIPWRCFLPEKTEGLIVTGRCLSADHYALGSVRVMVVCMPMGEACGYAAALACEEKCSLEELPVEKVRQALRAQGTMI
jgi:glycine/D-amino acid oxidase-like deaminating enzyme